MSMSTRYRVGSAGAMRAGGLAGDVPLLQKTIRSLQEKLLDAKTENQKVREQLACLSSLVKRAWTGDAAAAQHVAAIVGTAAPEIQQHQRGDVHENHLIVTAQPKSRALNNWARLVLALLNRQYCHVERQIADEQRRYLLHRQAYLDEQIQHDLVRPTADGDRWEIVQKTSATPHLAHPKSASQSRAQSAKKKPTMRHLYRPANQNPQNGTDGRMPSNVCNPEQEDCLLNKLSNGCARRGSGDPPDYADPSRYSMGDLYYEGTVVGAEAVNRRQRPSSGKEQRDGDIARSWPKSAVLPKGERPLKYETTRPVSTKGRGVTLKSRAASTGDLHVQQATRRPPSGKQWLNSHTFITSHAEPRDPDHGRQDNPAAGSRLPWEDDSDDSWDSEEEHREQRRKAADEILVKIRKPESVVKYEQDVSRMGQMEEDFKSRTNLLQRKLGIPTSGMIG